MLQNRHRLRQLPVPHSASVSSSVKWGKQSCHCKSSLGTAAHGDLGAIPSPLHTLYRRDSRLYNQTLQVLVLLVWGPVLDPGGRASSQPPPPSMSSHSAPSPPGALRLTPSSKGCLPCPVLLMGTQGHLRSPCCLSEGAEEDCSLWGDPSGVKESTLTRPGGQKILDGHTPKCESASESSGGGDLKKAHFLAPNIRECHLPGLGRALASAFCTSPQD